MIDYLTSVADQLGISVALLLVIITWTVVWKLIALWTAARKKQLVWFIALALLSTVGILEILYVFIFSKFDIHHMKNKKSQRKKRL